LLQHDAAFAVEMSDFVKVFDLTGHVKCLGCQTAQLVFDYKLDTIGNDFILF